MANPARSRCRRRSSRIEASSSTTSTQRRDAGPRIPAFSLGSGQSVLSMRDADRALVLPHLQHRGCHAIDRVVAQLLVDRQLEAMLAPMGDLRGVLQWARWMRRVPEVDAPDTKGSEVPLEANLVGHHHRKE